jgi:hypothetical protein
MCTPKCSQLNLVTCPMNKGKCNAMSEILISRQKNSYLFVSRELWIGFDFTQFPSGNCLEH